ncbi:unnamed protein product [Vicia faba]|uniref:Uncharacterized protein n=1 Tax=Vicia faba TaxID=3906 RepID=A0AAV1ADC8_VICFA|nr:unnamed protein product [Vicia faba]
MQKTNSNIEVLRVQALSILCTPHPFLDFSFLAPIQDKVDQCCDTKDPISDDASFDFDGFAFIQDKLNPYCSTKIQINSDSFLDFEVFAPVKDKSESYCSSNQQIHNSDGENTEEREFTFSCTDVQGMEIFADDKFENGKMRTLLPTFNQSLQFFPTTNNNASHLRPPIKNIFIMNSISPKSISGGSSNLWRLRQNLNLRSNSDHMDSYVILNPSVPKTTIKPKVDDIIVKKRKGDQPKNTLSAYEKLYVKNKMRKGINKRRSFLPYKHNIFGFFTNMHGLSRNLHPF